MSSSGVRCSGRPTHRPLCAAHPTQTGPCAVTQQTLQARAVVRRYANAGVYREAAVLVAQLLHEGQTHRPSNWLGVAWVVGFWFGSDWHECCANTQHSAAIVWAQGTRCATFTAQKAPHCPPPRWC